jgi:hypothetical protein
MAYPFPLPLFPLLNVAVMPLWFGLLFFPRKRWVRLSIDLFAGLAALLFTVNLLPVLKDIWPVVIDPTLPRVVELLAVPRGAFGAWTHFLIGDLWVGRWIVTEGHQRGIRHAWLIPILILTLLFGPVGLVAFLVVRGVWPAANR